MMMLEDDLKRAIQKAAIDGALTEKAAEQVKETFAENAKLKDDAKSWETKFEEQRDKANRLYTELEKARGTIKAFEAREADLVKREQEITKLELTAKFEAQRVQDHKDMVGQIFRNIETRGKVFTGIPGVQATTDQYGNHQPALMPYVHENDTVETKE